MHFLRLNHYHPRNYGLCVNRKLADAQFFVADAQFFMADAQFFMADAQFFYFLCYVLYKKTDWTVICGSCTPVFELSLKTVFRRKLPPMLHFPSKNMGTCALCLHYVFSVCE